MNSVSAAKNWVVRIHDGVSEVAISMRPESLRLFLAVDSVFFEILALGGRWCGFAGLPELCGPERPENEQWLKEQSDCAGAVGI